MCCRIIIIIMFILFSLWGCTHGPKNENKSVLNYLNREQYVADVTTDIVPLSIKRIKKHTTLKGNCYFKAKNDDFKYPVRFNKIRIMKDGKLMVDNIKFKGQISISVNTYKVNDINFEVEKLILKSKR